MGPRNPLTVIGASVVALVASISAWPVPERFAADDGLMLLAQAQAVELKPGDVTPDGSSPLD
jgi:hypothetical protein